MKSVRLVTRADDAGMAVAANRAIRNTVRDGIVRNVSLMAPAPRIRNAFELLGELQNEIDFGLHVVLTSEWVTPRWGPVLDASDVPTLVRRDGTFYPKCEELEAADPSLDEMMREVAAQYDLLVDLGFQITYLDEHMLVGAVGGLKDALKDFAQDHGLIYSRALLEGETLAWLPAWGEPAEHPGTELADFLADVEPGTYLLVGHPGTKDEEMQPIRLPGEDSGTEAIARNRQRRMFMDIEIVDYCDNVGIELLRYSDL
jgi:hypothetical protein